MAGDLQSSRSSALCYLGASGGLVPGLQSYLLAGGGRSSPGGSSLPTDSPPSHPATEEELEEDYYGNTVHPGLYQHIYGHPGNPYSKLHNGTIPSICAPSMEVHQPQNHGVSTKLISVVISL